MSGATMQTPAPVQVTGTVTRPAELRYSAGAERHAILVAEFSTGKGMPYLVMHDIGIDPGAHLAAEAMAKLLGRGSGVRVCCAGILPRTDHGYAVLRCMDVIDVIPHSPQPLATPLARLPASRRTP